MKKLGLCFVCFIAVAFQVRAIDISAGIGGDIGLIFTKTDTTIPEFYHSALPDVFNDKGMLRWGISAFFDAHYIEVHAGFKFLIASYNDAVGALVMTDSFFNGGLKVKYPFKISDKVSIFPLYGFDYAVFTMRKFKGQGMILQSETGARDDLDSSNAFDRFSLNLGLGVDFLAMQNVYIRGELNYTILFNTKSQKDRITESKAVGYELAVFQNGPVFKLGIGYKF